MTEILTEFLQEFTLKSPLLARRYHTFNWGNLANAPRVRMSPTSAEKHIKTGLMPSGISYDDYRAIWKVYSHVKKNVKHRQCSKDYYNKTKNNDCYKYQTRIDKGLINRKDECERKKAENKRKKERIGVIDKLRCQAKLFGIDEASVDKMDNDQLEFWGSPIKSVVEATGAVSYLNPCSFHYHIGSNPNTTINMDDYI